MFVICCGMMRSGSTLQYQLTVAILEKTGKGKGLGEVRHCEFSELEQAYPNEMIKVIKLHQLRHLRGAKEALESGKAVGLYTYRDLRDVTVSLINRRKISFDQVVFNTKEVSECLNNFYLWTSSPKILMSQYETMIQDLPTEVLRIAEYLGVNLSPEEAQIIADDHNLDKQKNRIQQWQNNRHQSSTREPKTLLHASHINSGSSQQWKTKLNLFQIGYLEILTGDWLKEQGYTLSQPFYIRWLSQLAFSKYFLRKMIKRLRVRVFQPLLKKTTT